MSMQVASPLLGVLDLENRPVGEADLTGIAALTTAFAVEGRAVKHQLTGLPGPERAGLGTPGNDGGQPPLILRAVIAEELAGPDLVAHGEPDRVRCGIARGEFLGPRIGALLVHGLVETGLVHRHALGAQGVLGEVEREAIGVIELEGRLARQRIALCQTGGGLFQQAEPPAQACAGSVLPRP